MFVENSLHHVCSGLEEYLRHKSTRRPSPNSRGERQWPSPPTPVVRFAGEDQSRCKQGHQSRARFGHPLVKGAAAGWPRRRSDLLDTFPLGHGSRCDRSGPPGPPVRSGPVASLWPRKWLPPSMTRIISSPATLASGSTTMRAPMPCAFDPRRPATASASRPCASVLLRYSTGWSALFTTNRSRSPSLS